MAFQAGAVHAPGVGSVGGGEAGAPPNAAVNLVKSQAPCVTLEQVPEVCHVFCATANPVEVLVAETGQGRGVVGVIDGSSPLGVEGTAEEKERKTLLRKLGYKL